MDQASKIFLMMLLSSILIGACIVAGNPRYRTGPILRSNAQYFPQADETMQKKFKK